MIAILRQVLAAILIVTLSTPLNAIASDPSGMNGSVTYTYDPVGNRTQKVSTLPGYPGGLTSYNANDQLASDTYDNDGNTTASNGVGYVYDFENHLVQAGAGINIVYDGDGNRVSKTVAGVTTTYLVADENPTGYAQVIEEDDSTGAARQYTYGLELISRWDTNTGLSIYYVHDGHGSVRALTNQTGAVTDTYDYDAFGNLIHSTGTTPNSYLFAGEQFDPDLHLYYSRARYLNTSTGRFWTMDTNEGAAADPLYLHKYLYAEQDPVDGLDPSGHLFVSTLAYGEIVHDAIGADFEARVPGGIYDKSVKKILGLDFGALGRPDLTDTLNHLGYEIKPVGSAALGAAQLAGYLVFLTMLDHGRNVWLPGELYFPPTAIRINAHAIALVSPPIAGVIIYEVIDDVEILGLVSAAIGYQLYTYVSTALILAPAGAP
jgi:RHS repeat-associated protein